MAHRGLSNERKRIRLRHIVTAHDLQNGREHDAPGSNAILQLFYVCRVFNPSLGGIERNHQCGV